MKKLLSVIILLLICSVVFALDESGFWESKKQFDDMVYQVKTAYNKGEASFVKQWKADLNSDNIQETIIANFTFYGHGTWFSCKLKIYHPEKGIIFLKDIENEWGGFVLADLDKDFSGKEIIWWQYFPSNPSSVEVSLYVWNGQKYEISNDDFSSDVDIFSSQYPQNVLSGFLGQIKQQAKIREAILKLRSKTIQEAVRKYNRIWDSYDSTSESSQRFTTPKIVGDYASISDYCVDKKGQINSEYASYLLKRDSGGWFVLVFNDEGTISSADVYRYKIPIQTLKKLGWGIYD